MSPPHIRLARAGDAEGIAAVLHDAFVEFKPLYTEAAFDATVVSRAGIVGRMSEGPVWVAEIDRVIIGTVGAVATAKGLYVRGMAVAPHARGGGIAQRLLAQAEQFGSTPGQSLALLSTTPFLHAAIRLYERAGYVRIDDGPNDLFGTPLLTMAKRLTQPPNASMARGR
jgi:putative acetyltransferase